MSGERYVIAGNVQPVTIVTVPDPAAQLITGTKTVTSAGTAEQITATSTPLQKGVTIVANSANTGVVYIGDSAVDSSSFSLAAGEQIFFPIDDLSKVWLDVSVSAEGVSYIAY